MEHMERAMVIGVPPTLEFNSNIWENGFLVNVTPRQDSKYTFYLYVHYFPNQPEFDLSVYI